MKQLILNMALKQTIVPMLPAKHNTAVILKEDLGRYSHRAIYNI